MNKRKQPFLMARFLAAKTGALSTAPPSAHRHKGIVMLRSIGFLAFLALVMVGCGGGSASSTPPPPATYTVGGTVTGLSGPGLVLNSNFGGDLAVSASGSFAFSTRLPTGSTFSVAVKNQPTSSPALHCQVVNGTGTIAAANAMNVTVTCGAGYTVGGTVSGLVGSGLTLAICTPIHSEHPHGCPTHGKLQIGANGAFTLDSSYPASYSGGDVVIIARQPSAPPQRCTISNTTVSIQNANDNSLTVSCATFLYVTNAADNTLSSYSVDATTGALTVIGAATATGASPHAIVGVQYPFYTDSEVKRNVFVGNEGSNDVSAFAVNNTTGALTAVPGSPFPAGIDPQAMTVNVGDFSLYVMNAGSDTLSTYGIDPSTGSLAEASTIAAGKSPASILWSYGYMFVANHGGSNDISAFETGPPPVRKSSFPVGGNPLSLALAVGAGGVFLYSANPDATNPSISGFSIDPTTGALSPLSGSPFPLPVSHYIAADLTGAYLYVTSGANVVGYSIEANTGALTALAGFPVTAGADAYSITIDPTDRFLYVTDDGAAHVSGFRLDASTGALTPMSGSPFPTGNRPEFIATF